ncbi:MAG: helix-turn-helix domain-containing protein, partial [Sporomusa sp.]
WTDIKSMEAEIQALRLAGKTRQEIADELGLTKVQIKNWMNRYNREQARQSAGIPPKRRGRPRKNALTTQAEYQYEIGRLKRENELLRDFLRLTGRR